MVVAFKVGVSELESEQYCPLVASNFRVVGLVGGWSFAEKIHIQSGVKIIRGVNELVIVL